MKRLYVALLVLGFAAGAQAQALRDPFARPAGRPAPGSGAAEQAGVEAEPEVPPQLRAIMYSPRRSLANINGQILAPGERFGEYQLIKVKERSVTLVKRGVTSVLALDEASAK